MSENQSIRSWQIGEFFGKLSVILTIVTGACLFVIHARFLYVIIVRVENLPEHVGMTKERILYNYDWLMSYMNNPFERHFELPDFHSSAQGIQHFEEVRVLFVIATVLFVLSLFGTVVYLRKTHKERSWWKFIQPMRVAMIVPIVLGITTALFWEKVFIVFHELLFNNDYWLFSPSLDPVIEILPYTYFFLTFIVFFVLMEAAFLFLFWKGKRSL